MKRPARWGLATGILAMVLGVVGCGGVEETNLSTSSQNDPEKFRQAQAQAEQAAKRAAKAEAKKFKGALKVETE